jgi:two-component system OmpR family sensor kinase/two-component system sensor histidine kinase QseC
LPDEVAPLVRSLNALLDRLALAWAGQRAFVADAAHELRSPLTALKLQAQVLRRLQADDADRAQRQAALDALVSGVDRAGRLVEQLLALARNEPGAPGATREPIALPDLMRQVLADVAPLAAARGSTLSLQADAPLSVDGDPAALAVLLRNLVDNALRYAPAGGQVLLTLGAAPQGPWLTVDDDGPGIAPADRARVFERFVRGAASSETTGSGLGLAIVRSIALRHGAEVSLETSPLGGLRVRLQFGALPASDAASAPA